MYAWLPVLICKYSILTSKRQRWEKGKEQSGKKKEEREKWKDVIDAHGLLLLVRHWSAWNQMYFLREVKDDFAWDYMYICMWLNTTLRAVKRLNKIVHGRENAARREKLHYRYQTLARICCRGIFVPSLYQGRTRAVPAPCQGRSSITRIEAEKRGLGWWVEVVKIRDNMICRVARRRRWIGAMHHRVF